MASKIDTLFESTVPSFSSTSTDKCDAIVKLSAESFTSTVKDFDTSIKFNASTAEEYVDLPVVPESLYKRSWFRSCFAQRKVGLEVALEAKLV